ncbi:hypothetical protein BDY21DRAFT_365926 [Lineolata rhizophorae]|uniref:Uncharacterized protein n=1 Tax=Lineolata rhizophorae TaxID=578093 RepID=A0A6A6NT42_9PEZI|nr:hypothetical protein BDY21DRAFT_365926 [Lineolata rhizophorae]
MQKRPWAPGLCWRELRYALDWLQSPAAGASGRIVLRKSLRSTPQTEETARFALYCAVLRRRMRPPERWRNKVPFERRRHIVRGAGSRRSLSISDRARPGRESWQRATPGRTVAAGRAGGSWVERQWAQGQPVGLAVAGEAQRPGRPVRRRRRESGLRLGQARRQNTTGVGAVALPATIVMRAFAIAAWICVPRTSAPCTLASSLRPRHQPFPQSRPGRPKAALMRS